MTKKPQKTPPNALISSLQLDLFSQFLTNDESEVSNSVEYWENIPKYFFTTKQIQALRNTEGLSKPYEWHYTIRNRDGSVTPYKIEIQPALIKQKEGGYKAFFPTKTEENIEEVLKKIFTKQQYGIHDPQNLESWVKFSYSMIRRELYRMNCGLRHDQIKHSLEIMSKCILTVWKDDKEVYTGAILQNYCSVDREDYLADRDTLHAAQLPIFISHSINTLQYRQYNYLRFMKLKEQLTGYLYKRLVNRFIQANYTNSYSFMYSDVKQGSGMLQQQREVDNRRKILSSLKELKTNGVISSYEIDERKKGRKIEDIKYTITPSTDFIAEQKAANKRASEGDKKALNNNLPIVDK